MSKENKGKLCKLRPPSSNVLSSAAKENNENK